MPTYIVPGGIREFVVVRGDDGTFAVADSGRPPGGAFFMPCRDLEQAERLRDVLNRQDHDGQIQFDWFDAGANAEDE